MNVIVKKDEVKQIMNINSKFDGDSFMYSNTRNYIIANVVGHLTERNDNSNQPVIKILHLLLVLVFNLSHFARN